MNKETPYKKGKGAYLYDIKGNKFYDFRFNTNIIGYSCSKLTTVVKNNISSSWNIIGDSIYHRRMIKLLENLFSNKYEIGFSYSLENFFLRIISNLKDKFSYKIHGKRFKKWFDESINTANSHQKEKFINIFDMADYYLLDSKIKKDSINILNYFWYPDTQIDTKNADIIILPELFNGNFKYIIILINKKSELYKQISSIPQNIENLPSLYISSSLKLYYLIEKLKKDQKKSIIKLNWDNVLNRGRIFTFNTVEHEEINNICRLFLEKNILLNDKPPYYNYLPINLDEYQEKFLLRKIND